MKKMLLGLVLLCGMSVGAFAQDEFRIDNGLSQGLEPAPKPPHIFIGIVAGSGRTFHSEGISISNTINFDPAQSGLSLLGLQLEYYLGAYSKTNKWDNAHLDWDARIALRTFYFNLPIAESAVSRSAENVFDENSKPLPLNQTKHTASFASSFINTELFLLQYLPIIDAMAIGGGFGIAIPLKGELKKRFEIIEPNGARFQQNPSNSQFQFEENGRVITLQDDDISKTFYYEDWYIFRCAIVWS
jgi:hypothetical protein